MKQKIVSAEMALSQIPALVKRIEMTETELLTLRSTVAKLIKKVDQIENHSTSNITVIIGIPDTHNETEQTLKHEVVVGMLQGKLNLSVTSVERIHRIGKPSSNVPRPIILHL